MKTIVTLFGTLFILFIFIMPVHAGPNQFAKSPIIGKEWEFHTEPTLSGKGFKAIKTRSMSRDSAYGVILYVECNTKDISFDYNRPDGIFGMDNLSEIKNVIIFFDNGGLFTVNVEEYARLLGSYFFIPYIFRRFEIIDKEPFDLNFFQSKELYMKINGFIAQFDLSDFNAAYSAYCR